MIFNYRNTYYTIAIFGTNIRTDQTRPKTELVHPCCHKVQIRDYITQVRLDQSGLPHLDHGSKYHPDIADPWCFTAPHAHGYDDKISIPHSDYSVLNILIIEKCSLSLRMEVIALASPRERGTHQENNKLLEWLEPVSPVVPAHQQISWTYVDMPESSTCAGRENHWCQSLALDLVHSSGTSCCDLFLSFIFTHTACKWS